MLALKREAGRLLYLLIGLLTVGSRAASRVVGAKRRYSDAETKLLERREILSVYRLYGEVTTEDAVDFATKF